MDTLAHFIPAHRTNKRQKKLRDYLWNLIDDNGNGLLSLSETRTGIFEYFKLHRAVSRNEEKYGLINKAFNLAKDFYPDVCKKSKKKKK